MDDAERKARADARQALFDRRLDEGAPLAWVAGILCGAGTIVYQAVLWLQTALWPSWSIASTYGISPRSDWQGVQVILSWLVDLPAWVGSAIAGGIAAWLAIVIVYWVMFALDL